ncbi:WalW protein [Marinobacter salinus]|uniref:WalW protein n=1 Tax=Marinobacter salinus TaxID=1874317 RepID=A0A1D9GIS2_9GAMM|nr:polysaccharide deacetylase family protein [Marinobacter salinus]AOY87503.1 WalW protein [Marinobacter salinus]
MFDQRKDIRIAAEEPPQLIVVIDTEEEFDWNSEPDSAATGVSAMQHIDRVQSIFNEYGIRPCYVIDYPVASQAQGYELLRQFAQKGQCEIGAHLHPWVNPPVDEVLSKPNTYPGNLPQDLERQKLLVLRDKIQENFGSAPVAYKAGRYGFGPNTTGILQELGFNIDLSVCPPLDSRADGGPDYRRYDAHPFWFGGNDKPILELPCTGAFIGWASAAAIPLFQVAQALRKFKAPGILSRLGAVDRLMLSPEGFNSAEHIKLSRALYNRGVRTFTWSFHSPSVVPGNTTYVQDDAQLRKFLDSFRCYFDFFFDELGGQASTPTRIRKLMESMA